MSIASTFQNTFNPSLISISYLNEESKKENRSLNAESPLGERNYRKRKQACGFQNPDPALPSAKNLISKSQAAAHQAFKKIRVNNDDFSSFSSTAELPQSKESVTPSPFDFSSLGLAAELPQSKESVTVCPTKDFLFGTSQNADIHSKTVLGTFEDPKKLASPAMSQKPCRPSHEIKHSLDGRSELFELLRPYPSNASESSNDSKCLLTNINDRAEDKKDVQKLIKEMLFAKQVGCSPSVSRYFSKIIRKIASLQKQIDADVENTESLREMQRLLEVTSWGINVPEIDLVVSERALDEINPRLFGFKKEEIELTTVDEICTDAYRAIQEMNIDLVKIEVIRIKIKIHLIQQGTKSVRTLKKRVCQKSLAALNEVLKDAQKWLFAAEKYESFEGFSKGLGEMNEEEERQWLFAYPTKKVKRAFDLDANDSNVNVLGTAPSIKEQEMPPYPEDLHFSPEDIPLWNLDETYEDLCSGIKERNIDLVTSNVNVLGTPPSIEEQEMPPYPEDLHFSPEDIPLGNLDETYEDLCVGIKERNIDLVTRIISSIKSEMQALRQGISLSDNPDQIRELKRNEAELAQILRHAAIIVCRDPVENLSTAQMIFDVAQADDRIWFSPSRKMNILHVASKKAASRGHVNIVKAISEKFSLVHSESQIPLGSLREVYDDLFVGINEGNVELVKDVVDTIKRELSILRKGIVVSENAYQVAELRKDEADLAKMIRSVVLLVCRGSEENLPIAEIVFDILPMEDRAWIEPVGQKNVLHQALMEVASRGRLILMEALLDRFPLYGHESDLKVYNEAGFQALKNKQFRAIELLEATVPLTQKYLNACEKIARLTINRYLKLRQADKEVDNPEQPLAEAYFLLSRGKF